jgi:hypothetical protein
VVARVLGARENVWWSLKLLLAAFILVVARTPIGCIYLVVARTPIGCNLLLPATPLPATKASSSSTCTRRRLTGI